MKTRAAAVLVALALLTLLIGQPTLDDRLGWMEPELDAELKKRGPHIDPGELLGLMYNNRVRLAVLDTRAEADFNLFHLTDSRRLDPNPGITTWARSLPTDAVKVVVGAGEKNAEETWKRLRAMGLINVYLLEGGVDGWLRAYHDDTPFSAAIGGRHAASRPNPADVAERKFKPKVKVRRASKSAGAGCG